MQENTKYNEDSDAWEDYYANNVEPLIEEIIGKLVTVAESVLIQDRTVVFDSEIKKSIAGLMAIQHSRGQNARDFQNALFEEFLPKAKDELFKEFKNIDKDDLEASGRRHWIVDHCFNNTECHKIVREVVSMQRR